MASNLKVCCGFFLAAVTCVSRAGENQGFSDLVQTSESAIVVVQAQNRDGDVLGIGTGFVIDAKGLIATAFHVIGEARPIQITTADGKSHAVTEVYASDRNLDLAILRIANDDMVALQIAAEPELPNGTSVFALGHPLGLEHSVVTGIVSAVREIDGRPMMQVAMPIEPGHSGGPILHPETGEVHAIMTMKSAETSNLGFAVPIAQLKPLLERPNPISIEQWQTIGQLDAGRWTALFGGQWRQRAGKILASQPGVGFGGRTLCLHKLDPPTLPIELGVWVKLKDESGAAGIVFHSDGAHRHFGFYPSNGKLRLTCFQGPTVFSWDVIQEVHAPGYTPGEWNHLKVRVEGNRISGYVNDRLVVEAQDTRLISGRVGLAKFRDTEVEFRDFRIGKSLPQALPTDADRALLAEALEQIPPVRERKPRDIETLITTKHSQRMVTERARQLRMEADRLERLAEDLHTAQVCQKLSDWMDQAPEARDLLTVALQIAALDNPTLDAQLYVQAVDDMANRVRATCKQDASPAERLAALDRYLFVENGFHGSRTEYYHPANSHLDRVIDDREGLPITLSVLYLELAERLDLKVEGVGMPGHFIVRYLPAEGQSVFIDPFDRGKHLTRDEAAAIVAAHTGQVLTDAHLSPANHLAIAQRMLANLMGVAQRRGERAALRRYLEAVVTLDPDDASYRGMRAVSRQEQGASAAAVEDLDWILEREPPGIDLNVVRRMRAAFSQP